MTTLTVETLAALLTEYQRTQTPCKNHNLFDCSGCRARWLLPQLGAGAPPEGPVAAASVVAPDLQKLLAEAGGFVTLLAHGVEWEIAPSIQESARQLEPRILEALVRGAPARAAPGITIHCQTQEDYDAALEGLRRWGSNGTRAAQRVADGVGEPSQTP